MEYDIIDREPSFSSNKKEKLVAALFAIFLGTFGIHHFYLGNKGLGILYLIFCWTFLPGFIAFIEGILLLVMDEEEFDYKYNLGVPPSTTKKRKVKKKSYSSRKTYQEEEEDFVDKISIADEIEKLHDLMVRGIISEREFAERKDRL